MLCFNIVNYLCQLQPKRASNVSSCIIQFAFGGLMVYIYIDVRLSIKKIIVSGRPAGWLKKGATGDFFFSFL